MTQTLPKLLAFACFLGFGCLPGSSADDDADRCRGRCESSQQDDLFPPGIPSDPPHADDTEVEDDNATCADGCPTNAVCNACPAGCAACAWPEDWTAREDEMLQRVNAVRATGVQCPSGLFQAVGAVSADSALREAARTHAFEMANGAAFSHNSPDGRTPWDRIAAAGYDGNARSENIAAGNVSPEATLAQWIGSDGHCRNLMDPEVNELGIGYAYNNASTYGSYWVQNFGRRRAGR